MHEGQMMSDAMLLKEIRDGLAADRTLGALKIPFFSLVGLGALGGFALLSPERQ
jgi:hypothetical protein